jgi:DNA-binding IclR family transcriptional regulator
MLSCRLKWGSLPHAGTSADVARPSPSTIRPMRVLTLLGDYPDQALSLSEISHQLDLNKATVHSILAILTESGYVVREPTTKAYSLGPALIRIAGAGLRPMRDVLVAIHREMESLSEQIPARCTAMTAIGGRIVIVDAVGTAYPPIVKVGRGAVFAAPYAITLVAWAPEHEVARWLSGETLTDQERETYRERMRVVRDRGFSVATGGTRRKELEKAADELLAKAESAEVESALHQLMAEIARESNEVLEIVAERTYRLRAIAAPVFDANGKTIVAVSLSGLPELSGRQVRDYGYTLSVAMDRVTKQIGGRAPDTML